jgi:hypothetical protein
MHEMDRWLRIEHDPISKQLLLHSGRSLLWSGERSLCCENGDDKIINKRTAEDVLGFEDLDVRAGYDDCP